MDAQRKAYKNGTLSSDRKDKLSEIGFTWEMRKRKGKEDEDTALSKARRTTAPPPPNKKCSACGMDNIMKCLSCSFPGFNKQICIKEKSEDKDDSMAMLVSGPYDGCFLECDGSPGNWM